MVKRAVLVGIIAMTTLSGLALGGVTYTETTDIGALPGSATDLTGMTVETIIGNAGAGDVDMFKIYITDPTGFSASTENGGTSLDTQLQLFDAAGMGIYANDDGHGYFGPSLLPAGDPLSPASVGTYFLAVSRWSNDPLSSGGEIFAGDWDQTMGPGGPGGGNPIIGWEGDTGSYDCYEIALTGVGQAPEEGSGSTAPVPGSALLCGLGLVLSRSVRRGKAQAA